MKKIISLTMFDLLKGVAMLGVLFGHSVYLQGATLGSVWYGKILHSILMPAFFMVSGYWLKKKPIKLGIKNSFDYLIKPYLTVVLVINAVALIHRTITGEISEWVKVFLLPSLLVSTNGASRLGPLWFIVALFWAWVIYYVVIHIEGEKIQILIAVMCGIIGGALLPLKIPFQIAQGLIAFFFVYMGYLVKKHKLFEKRIHWSIYTFLIAFWSITVFWGSMDLYSHDVKHGFFSVVGSLCGAWLIIKSFLYVNLLEWQVLDGVRWIGRYSMWFLCIHAIENAVFPWKILFYFVERGSVEGTVLYFLLRLVAIVVVCIIMQQIQLQYVKKNKGEMLC